jgi:predicted metalloprotease
MAERERETIITTDGGSRGGAGTALVVLAIIALLVVVFLVFGQGLLNGSDTKTIKADVNIDTPAANN